MLIDLDLAEEEARPSGAWHWIGAMAVICDYCQVNPLIPL